MLIEPSVDVLEERVDNRHVLAILAAKRARDLLLGSRPITPEECENPVSQAAVEIAEGFITVGSEENTKSEDAED